MEPFTITRACMIKIKNLRFLQSNSYYKVTVPNKIEQKFKPVGHLLLLNTDYLVLKGVSFGNIVENESRDAIRFEAGEWIVSFEIIIWEWLCKQPVSPDSKEGKSYRYNTDRIPEW